MNELTQTLESMDPVDLMFGAGVLGAFATIILVGYVIWFFVSAFGYRKMFEKAGEAGWKAFIPYYNKFICFKMAWNTKMFWIYLVTLLCVQSLPSETENILINIILIVSGIVALVVGVKRDIRIASSFGKTKGWGVLLFFFPFIVSLILGYGKAEYQGNTTIE